MVGAGRAASDGLQIPAEGLGVLPLLAAAGDLLTTTTSLLPSRFDAFLDPVAKILAPGELPIVFWLPIWGARDPATPERMVGS